MTPRSKSKGKVGVPGEVSQGKKSIVFKTLSAILEEAESQYPDIWESDWDLDYRTSVGLTVRELRIIKIWLRHTYLSQPRKKKKVRRK